jgi:hypothetical protein
MLIPSWLSPFNSGVVRWVVAGARYDVISNDGKTITIETFGRRHRRK